LIVPAGVIVMFEGFRSRWMIPLLCAASSAAAMPAAHRRRVAHRHRSPKEALLQRLSFDQLENQERRALSLDDVEERADVGMVDLRDEARFALEAGETDPDRGRTRRAEP
jgi:hypothetical protein